MREGGEEGGGEDEQERTGTNKSAFPDEARDSEVAVPAQK